MLSEAFLKELEKSNISFCTEEKMSGHTTFKIGGPADVFVSVSNTEQLKAVLSAARSTKTEWFIIGKGSNLLVSDYGIYGAVISLDGMNGIKVCSNAVICGAGARLSGVCRAAADAGLSGLEFAYGIPGGVGGALFMNAGAYGGEISEIAAEAECMDRDGNVFTLGAGEMKFGYRTSIFREKGYIILSAKFVLNHGNSDEIRGKMDDFLGRRKSKQPLEYPSAGSTFKRPAGYYAGALIEKNGFKGKCCGGAEVSEKHAGFIINKGGASAKDVETLIKNIQESFFKNDGVKLETEVIRVGRG